MNLSPSLRILVFVYALSGIAPAGLLRPHGAPASQHWLSSFSFGEEIPEVGDFNGDGLDDVITFFRSYYGGGLNGDAMVSLNTVGDFGNRTLWHPFFGINDETVRVGDFDGDGRDDIATFLHGTGGIVYVALSNGSSFNTSSVWATGIATGKGEPFIGDFNGDGRDDIASFNSTSGEVHVFNSTGSSFLASGRWLDNLGVDVAVTGDFDGDGLDDIGGVRALNGGLGTVYVALSTSSAFDNVEQWMTSVLFDFESEVFASDFTGDGVDDLALVSRLGALWVTPSEGDSFHYDPTSVVWNSRIRSEGEICLPGHFNRDLNADFAVFVSGGNNGDVKVSLTGGHAVPDSIDPAVFGYGTMGVPWVFAPLAGRPAVQELPLVLAIFEFGDRPAFGAPLGRDAGFFDNLYFGPDGPNIRDWFLEMSNGAFTFSRAGVLTIQIAAVPPGDARPAMVQAMADAGFDFRPFDTDGNGLVDTDELCIAGISNFGTAGGQTGGMVKLVEYADGPDCQLATLFSGADHLGAVDLYAHEVAHLTTAVDLYSSNCFNRDATLMHCNGGVSSLVHFDAWHKMRLGWERPIVYDLRDGPATAILDAAQIGGRPPILVYDSALGTDQYYLLEYRSPLATLGTQIWDAQDGRYLMPDPPADGFTAAGYDADFGKRGVAAWYARMGSPNGHARQKVGVDKGAGGIIDSSPAGDDLLEGDKITPGPDQILQTTIIENIHPGPDEILQSVRAGDDVLSSNRILPGPDNLFSTILAGDDGVGLADNYAWDELVFLTTDPVQLAGRGAIGNVMENNNYLSDFKWQGPGKTLQVGVLLNSVNTSTIGWGGPFRPFLEGWPTSPIRAGETFTVTGKMGPSLGSLRPTIYCESTGQSRQLAKAIWSSSHAAFRLPRRTAPGDYLFYIESTDGYSSVVSNTIRITVEDTYQIWRSATFTAAELLDPSISGPQVDLDGDGLPTLGEFATGGDPWVFEPHLRPRIEGTESSAYYYAPVLKLTSGVYVDLEYSVDLIRWSAAGPGTITENHLGNPDLTLWTREWNLNVRRRFFRMVYIVAER